jgi:hypothetical protein
MTNMLSALTHVSFHQLRTCLRHGLGQLCAIGLNRSRRSSLRQGCGAAQALPHLSRFPPLEVFVRRPPALAARPGSAGIRKPSQTRTLARIAVGTLIAERPPHRSVRAAFPHTAPTLGNGGSPIRMQSNDWCTYVGAVSDARVALNCISLGPRPSLHRLRRRSLGFVRRLHRYYGSV